MLFFFCLAIINSMAANRSASTLSLLAKQTVITGLLFCCSGVSALYADSGNNNASKRIEVYALTQNFWDVHAGDTLSEITQHLLPNNPSKREALQLDILRLNPAAFIDGDPALLIAGKRLWLPAYMKQADSKVNPATTTIETYSWGNVKRQKN